MTIPSNWRIECRGYSGGNCANRRPTIFSNRRTNACVELCNFYSWPAATAVAKEQDPRGGSAVSRPPGRVTEPSPAEVGECSVPLQRTCLLQAPLLCNNGFVNRAARRGVDGEQQKCTPDALVDEDRV
ncbi:hypothetical protein MAPG_09969 [Magnaporthiopsis poae ATCC 64411]|uniref:Uncharacterized protein n=1 Tax=Magnaporthiopsis poae (strain ATCC 64411 / 73-15) TaxID=644358 RepID=A0A0C4EBC1_MAGP6|nr:hypothetical protein MAPG_09969 [Magnaporthiopsis poae ATCC 64411]